jgi:SAM-dependent methyltransferase
VLKETVGNLDKIYDAYKGTLCSNIMLSTRERFSWQASMVKGENILDIGCSQGILGILLAREGKKVVGVDISEDAILFANSIKNQEHKDVRKNIKFLVGDYSFLKLEEKFDTIILGEVLEHLYYPEKILKKIKSNLKDGGRIIITVPFGINDYYDHRKTYYLYDILRLLREEFLIKDIKYSEIREYSNWIGFVGEFNRKKNKKVLFCEEEYLEPFENNIEKRERLLLEKLEKQDLSNKHLQEALNSTKIQIEEAIREEEEKKKELIKKLEESQQYNYILSESLRFYENRKIIRLISILKKFLLFPIKFLKNVPLLLKTFLQERRKKELISFAEFIPESNGSSFYKKVDLNVAIVTDEFMFNYYKDALNLGYVNYDNYKEIINDSTDIVLFVSCWRGMQNDDWRGIGLGDENMLNKLFEIFDYGRIHGAKVVFQTIEDPSNYNVFLPIAKKTDYIFTSDYDKIDDYKRDTMNDKVFFLEYGVNPLIHNPIGLNVVQEKKINTINTVFFAGSWATRYEERCQDMQRVFKGVIKSHSDLLIADRNFYKKEPSFKYPEQYSKYIIPEFNHLVLQKIHKLFDWNINLNSIKYSSTMCAMRVYELQALGSLLLSNYSKAVVNKFPNVFIINNKENVSAILSSYSNKEKYEMKVRGIRNVLSGGTVFDRILYIAELLKIDINGKIEDTVVILCKRESKEIRKMFEEQTYKKKILMTEGDFLLKRVDQYKYLTFFSPKYEYGPYYIEDMMNCFKFVNVAYVTKLSSYDEEEKLKGVSHNFVNKFKDKYSTIFNLREIKFTEIKSKQLENRVGYSSDPFELNERRIR